MLENRENHAIFDEFGNSLTSYLSTSKEGERVPLLSDFYLPNQNLGHFLENLDILEEKLKLDLPIYGSYLTSTYSLRPGFNLTEPDFNKKALTLLKAGAYVIDRQSGLLAGKTPEGRVKAIITNSAFSDEEKALYGEIKTIFDENGILNPSVKLGADTRSTIRYFRTSSPAKIVI